MARATTTDRRWSGWVSLLVASAAVITGVLLGGTHLLLPEKSKTPSILMIFAKDNSMAPLLLIRVRISIILDFAKRCVRERVRIESGSALDPHVVTLDAYGICVLVSALTLAISIR